VISAHLSFSALYLAKRLASRQLELPIAAFATTVTTGRRSDPLTVNVSGVRSRLDIAAVPVAATERAEAACRQLFGERFERRADLLAIALSNLNPPAHMANSLLNFTRMERAEAWENYGCITEGVGRLVEALDRERLAVAAAFGLQVRTIVEHYVLSFNVAPGSVHEMAQAVNRARGGNPPGPKTADTRYVLEDVPFGLVPIVALGRIAGVAVPLHEAGVELFSAIYARDFRAENDLLPDLGLARMDAAALQRLVRDGFAPSAATSAPGPAATR
jgi:opine dehydrogenase